MYVAVRCTTSAAYPNAVATLSSFTSLRPGKESGGAGSLGIVGMGRGTSTIVKRRSGGETNSIGKMKESMESRDVRQAVRCLESSERRLL